MKRQSQLRIFLQEHYMASLVAAFLGGLLASTSSHFINRLIDKTAFDVQIEPYSVTDSAKYFPVEEGNTWIYSGKHDYTIPNSNKVDSEDVTLRMTVLRMHRFPHLILAELSDWPFDHVWGRDSEEECALLFIGNKVYKIDDPAKIAKVSRSGDASGALEEEDLLLEFPLCKGKSFGQSKIMGREDLFYVWQVEEEYDIASSFSNDSKRAYKMAYKTNPDHMTLTFQPHVGIIEHEYVHHGTVEKLSLSLSQFIAKRRPK